MVWSVAGISKVLIYKSITPVLSWSWWLSLLPEQGGVGGLLELEIRDGKGAS